MLKCRINPSMENLTKLHATYPWIPSGSNVRPSANVLTQKAMDMSRVMYFYESLRDYLLEEIFNVRTEINENGKCFVKLIPADFFEFDCILRENKYPYQVSDNATHYVLWYPMFSREDTLSDSQITRDVTRHLEEKIISTGGTLDFDFVWYVNPKMTVKDLFHVQVFVHRGLSMVTLDS